MPADDGRGLTQCLTEAGFRSPAERLAGSRRYLPAMTHAVDEIMADMGSPTGLLKREIALAVFAVAAGASEFDTAKLVKMAPSGERPED